MSFGQSCGSRHRSKRGRSAFSRAFALALLTLAVAMCGPQASGESHLGNLLLECSSTSACSDGANPVAGLACFCSFCTLPCTDVESCQAELGGLIAADQLRCRHPACLPNEGSELPAGAGVCDVACEADADCQVYDPDLRCVGGYCRAQTLDDAPPRCPAGAVFVRGSPDASIPDLCVDVHEVTVAEYTDCVAAAACDAPEQGNYYVADRDEHPIEFVSAENARTYCEYRGRALPARAQWSWAAQNGAVTTAYPWGDAEPSAGDARACALDTTSTCAVDTFPAGATSAGIADLAGNVAELVEDGADVCAAGGSFLAMDAAALTSAACTPFTAPAADVGFRCVSAPE